MTHFCERLDSTLDLPPSCMQFNLKLKHKWARPKQKRPFLKKGYPNFCKEPFHYGHCRWWIYVIFYFFFDIWKQTNVQYSWRYSFYETNSSQLISFILRLISFKSTVHEVVKLTFSLIGWYFYVINKK